MNEYIARVNPYEKQKSLSFDMRGYSFGTIRVPFYPCWLKNTMIKYFFRYASTIFANANRDISKGMIQIKKFLNYKSVFVF